MKKHYNTDNDPGSLRDKIMGLGERSMRKSYYPELQKRIKELEASNDQLKEYIEERTKARDALAESKALLDDIINYQPTGTYRLRLDKSSNLSLGIQNNFSFDFLSDKFCQIIGIAPKKPGFNPFNLIEILHPDDRDKFIEKNDLCIKNFSPFFWEGRILVHGEQRWIQMESYPRQLANGDRVWTGVTIDFTARKKTDEELRISEERFKLIFESSPVGIISYDEKGYIKACNHQFAKLLKEDRNILLGKNLLELPRKKIAKALKKAISGKNSIFEGSYRPAKNTPSFLIRIQFAPIFDKHNTVKGGVAIAQDLSEQIKNQKLEQEILVTKKSAEFKQNFLANMSHEIRTPLTGIEGMAYILSRTGLSEAQQEYLDTIITSSQNLREIINQILDYSKIEAGQMLLKPRPTKISELFQKVEKLLASLCTDKIPYKVFVSSGITDLIETDDQKIFQIITNFVSNAVKYAPQGLITVKIQQSDYHKDGMLKFRVMVTDKGPGISPEKQKDIFNPFSQLDRDDLRTVEGTGLGLSISKEMAKILGGNIGVQSQPGKGSCFWFSFAAKESNLPVTHNEPNNHFPQGKNLNILLVEDKKINQKVISLILQSLGHKVCLADNGQMALETFKPGEFDLILMDIQMPVMDGITATKKIRRSFKKVPPIIGLSANAFEGDKERYISMGLDDYLTKPVTTNDFNEMLRRWF